MMANKVTQSKFVDLSVPPPLFDFTVPPPIIPQTVEAKIASFLRARNKDPTTKSRRKRFVPNVALGDIKSDFAKSQTLLADLESVQQQLEANPDSPGWQALVVRAETCKTQLQIIESKYKNSEILKDLEKLHNRRTKKRQRIKRRSAAVRQQHAESRQAYQARIEQWQRDIATQLQTEKTANAEAALAKSVLAAVTKKISDAKKYLAEFQALIELRMARKIAVQASDLGERDFEASIRELEHTWQAALTRYRQEETDLRRVLEARSSNASKIIEKRWSQAIFGDQAATLHSHPMLKAEKNFEEFVAVRRAWDTCLVDGRDASGSHIPSGWVMPNADPISEWKIFQQDSTTLD